MSYKNIDIPCDKITGDYGNKSVTLEDVIKDSPDKVDWKFISIYQDLSESFIRKFSDRVDWYCISRYLKLSESFIREFDNKLNWDCLIRNRHSIIPEDLIIEHKNEINWNNCNDVNMDNFSKSFMEKYADELGLRRM